MNLTTAQLASLKAHILASVDPAVIAAIGGGAIGRNDTELARLYNLPSASVVWRSSMPGDELRNIVTWANMTPAATPDGSALWTNRALYAQAKQISLQTIVQGQTSIRCGVAGIRAGLQDCLTNLPTVNDGSTQPAGWQALRTAMQRFATVAEQVYIATVGSGATPEDLAVEGTVTINDIGTAMNAA